MLHASFLLQPVDNYEYLLQRGKALLNGVERSRYFRYARNESRQQLIFSRWLVHERLARSFPHLPCNWQLTFDALGRPAAQHPELCNSVNYSLSHCDHLTICAISNNAAIGIDAEPNHLAVKDSFFEIAFTDLERETIRSSHWDSIQEMRFRWTIKESLGKMTGQIGFESIVAFCTATIACRNEPSVVSCPRYRSWIYSIPVGSEHFATLAVSQDTDGPMELICDDAAYWLNQTTDG